MDQEAEMHEHFCCPKKRARIGPQLRKFPGPDPDATHIYLPKVFLMLHMDNMYCFSHHIQGISAFPLIKFPCFGTGVRDIQSWEAYRILLNKSELCSWQIC